MRTFILGTTTALLGLFCTHTQIVSADEPESGWIIDTGPIDPKQYFGVTVANGVVGMVSAPAPFKTERTLLNGAYEAGSYGATLLQTFNFLDLGLTIDGEEIDRFEQTRNFTQRLELRGAVLRTSFEIPGKATVSYAVRALRQFPNSALLDVTVSSKRALKIAVVSGMAAPPTLNEVQARDTQIGTYESDRGQRPVLRVRGISGKSRSGQLRVAASQTFMFVETPAKAPAIAHGREGLAFEKSLEAGTSYRFAIVGSTLSSAEVGDPVNEADRMTAYLSAQRIDELIKRHEREWQTLWRGDIVIQGDEAAQRAVRSMLYHLYSFVRADQPNSIPPMGLSNLGYGGHIFWDAEIWMFPALLALNPPLAKSMLDYRYDRLPAARRRATRFGFRGAMFPWESAATGDEETFGFLAGPLMHHITANVGIAAWNYYRVSQDAQWLRDKGYPLIKETADFWTSRVVRNGAGRYDILNVVAADEYAEFVDNNAYTNGAARQNLAAAIAASKILGLTPDPDWMQVRQNIPIPRFANGVTREHETYDGEQLKQADVNLLSFPLQEITDLERIRLDLEYYEQRLDLDHGPAMAKPVFAVLMHRLGMTERAFKVFKSGYEPNLRPPFGVLTECAKCSSPYFGTGAGGLLQAVLYGFGGLEITDRGLIRKDVPLPSKWKSLRITLANAPLPEYVTDDRVQSTE